jgi:transcriptional regulator of acetoin/glycerol metabolism
MGTVMGGTIDTLRDTDASGARIATHDVVRPQLVLVLERARPLAGGARYSLAQVDRVTLGRGPERAVRRVVDDGRPTLEIAIPDERISLRHARIDRVGNTWEFVDCGSTNGSRVNRVQTEAKTMSDGDVLEVGRTLFRYRAEMITPVNSAGDVDFRSLQGMQRSFGTLLPWLERDLDTLARVARSEVAVLLLGETGTGKELLARSIHQQSGREGRFVAVNCGGLPPTLIESLFFGHKRGSFSGAVRDEIGFVRAADGGTLFLDEVGDLPPSCQTALLRVLQEREVVPVGATHAVGVDVRIVAATHRPLPSLVKTGAFRDDLYARLSAFTYAVPPLRDRIDDIGVLVSSILARTADESARPLSFSAATAYALIEHRWPHNVRELEQRLKIGALLGSRGRIELTVDTPEPLSPTATEGSTQRKAITADEIELALRQTRNVSAAAKALRIHRSHLYRLIRHFGIQHRADSAGTD